MGEYVRKLHEKVKANIEKKVESYVKQANKGRKKVVFEPGDWVWVHLRKERFPTQRKSKLKQRGDGPFQVLSKINDNAYKIDLPGEYDVSATFKVADLSLFDAGNEDYNLRTNSSEEGGNDEDRGGVVTKATNLEDIQDLGGPMTRAKAKKAKEALNLLVTTLLETSPSLKEEETEMIHLIQIEDLEE
ncbi:hypothetical protein QN277_022896 [Acacia crassicarpa]|uniref:Tf2-1-like SH3-like domain-containing protein n=1 Tax=Acacia crassicarpa TaxID=499986 RepID=A0AAE1MLG7_9FABA|nr:hypothetical protein QN277_022896 [Acacia crassicarpa]